MLYKVRAEVFYRNLQTLIRSFQKIKINIQVLFLPQGDWKS